MMSKYRKFTSLTEEEIAEFVKATFSATAIRDVTILHATDEIIFNMATDGWGEDNKTFWDAMTISDPFLKSEPICAYQFEITSEDNLKLMQFCFAKGIFPDSLTTDNPFLDTKEAKDA